MERDTFSDIPSAATDLRCFPYDVWQMGSHRDALHRYADHLGLCGPSVCLDNGFRFSGPLPGLQRLVRLVEADHYRMVLVPGPFTFSHVEARCVIRQLTATGRRVVELPSARSRTVRR